MKKRFWRCFLFVVICITIGLCFFWEDVLLLFAPKAVLTASLTRVIDQLEDRFQDNPVRILWNALDSDGQYTAKVNMQTDNKLLGTVDYDMIIQTDLNAHRLHAAGSASTSHREIDLSLYMDTNYMAASSDGLVDGQYYGITYNSFPEDIRSIPLLRYMISDSLLNEWENSVNKIQEAMGREIKLPEIPKLEPDEIKALLFGCLALPCQTEETTFFLDDVIVNCKKMDYHLGGAEVGKVLSSLMNQSFGSDTSLVISFYLYEKSIVRIGLICKSGVQDFNLKIDLGRNPLENPLAIAYSGRDPYTNTQIAGVVDTRRAENFYSERWEINKEYNGDKSVFSCQYIWDANNGEMKLRLDDVAEEVSLDLRECEEGIYVATDDVIGLVRMMTKSDSIKVLGNDVDCSMIISDGSQINKPEYKNLNQWSVSDFLELMGGIGSLISINLK